MGQIPRSTERILVDIYCYQSLFAVISTVGIWLRISITFKSEYGRKHSFDWWILNMAVTAQVTHFIYKHQTFGLLGENALKRELTD